MSPNSSDLAGLPDLDWLDRSLAGEATADDVARVEAWRAESPANEMLYRELAELRLVARGVCVPDMDRARALIARETGFVPDVAERDATNLVTESPKPRFARSISRSGQPVPSAWQRFAMPIGLVASILFVLGVALTSIRTRPSSSVTARRYATRSGQHATVTLIDGSRAELGPSTTMTVTSNADGGINATVFGEVLMTVQHHARAPFVVQTSRMAVRVLGTTFGVRQYAADRTARVVVVDGRVAVSTPRSSLRAPVTAILNASTLGVVGDSGTVVVTPNIAVNDYTSWTVGHLVFDGVPVRDVLVDLGRAYDVELQVRDSALAHHLLTWRLDSRTVSLTKALDELATLLDARFAQTDRVITLIPGRHGAKPMSPVRFPFPKERSYGR